MEDAVNKAVRTFASYNLLAPVFCRPKNALPGTIPYFGHCAEENLAWCYRQPLLQSTIRALNAHVLALQEVQMERDDTTGTWTLPAYLRELPGYRWVIPRLTEAEWKHQSNRNLRVLDDPSVTGLATMFREDRFELVRVHSASRSLVVVLQDRTDGSLVSVANVHLEGAPNKGGMRKAQLCSAVQRAKKALRSHVVVMGDFNSVGNGEAENLSNSVGLRKLELGASWSNGAIVSSLDHILVSEDIKVENVRNYLNEEDRRSGMPNSLSGSDHCPIAAELRWSPIPEQHESTLSEEQKNLIEKAVEGLGSPPTKVKGKPSSEQLVVLKAWATTKKDFLAHYEDQLEIAYAKKLLK